MKKLFRLKFVALLTQSHYSIFTIYLYKKTILKLNLCTLATTLIIYLGFNTSLVAQSFSDGFSFTLPPFDSSSQEFLPVFPRNPINEFVRTSNDHFFSGDHPIRFWGVNFTTGACFPEKSLSPMIAARMRKMGINLVRFHHMDNPWSSSNASIFNQNGSTTVLNRTSLDRLHYLLSKMKGEGVYANINLHVSRTFTESDGVVYADSILDFGKGVTMFDRQLIELQKQYATQLLTSTNPYTNLTLVDDPVVAMVEITNENTLYGFWKDDRLQPFSQGGAILSRHADTLDRLWNNFLLEKYSSQANLSAAWSNGESGIPVQLLRDGGFESGNLNQAWRLEQHENAQASMALTTNNPYDGNYAAMVQVNQITGTNWHIQFEQNGASVDQDSAYIIRFHARADAPRTMQVNSIRNAEPWTWYGGTTIQLTTEWQEYKLSIVPPESNTGLTRVAFIVGGQTGTYWFDEVSMTLAQQNGLEAGEDLNLANIRRISYSERFGFDDHRVADMAEFYLQLQRAYYDEMYDFLKNTLDVKVPVTGSNALGGLYEPYTHQGLDYMDDHAYWDHPRFPGVAWSSTDWLINNQSMLSSDYLGTIPGIFGGYQIQNKPFTISEYNHPQPNIYQAEMVPILSAYGAFHGADGFMFFEYNGGDPADWTTDAQFNYFATHRNTPVMALFPIFSYAFQNGLIREDPAPILTAYSTNFVQNLPQEDNQGRWGSYYPYDSHLGLTSAIKIADFASSENSIPSETLSGGPFKTNTNEIKFDPDNSKLQIVTPRLECVVGQLNPSTSENQRMKIIEGNKHGVISWLSLTDEPLQIAEKSLLTISSRFQNHNMQWDGQNTLHNNWGNAPTEVQPLNLVLSLDIEADSIRLFTLDPLGAPADSFTVISTGAGEFLVSLDQSQWKTLWFGIRSFPAAVSNTDESFSTLELYPNPVDSDLMVVGDFEDCTLRILNPLGQTVQWYQDVNRMQNLDLSDLQSGIYFVQIQSKSSARVTVRTIIKK